MLKYARFSSDHGVVGIQFLITSFAYLLVGGALALALRAEVTLAGANLIQAEGYARLFTNHGTVMIFLWLLPALTGLAHAVLPSTIGLRQPRYPRLGAVSFWLLAVGGVLLIVSFFVGGASAGWTGYLPLALQVGGLGQTLWSISLMIVILSLGLSAVSFVGTILGRYSGQFWDAPLYAVAVLIGSLVSIISSPLLLIALGAVSAVRLGGLSEGFLSSATGVAVWSNAFWFFAHPAAFAMLLPPIGIVSEVIQTFSGQRLVQHRRVAAAMAAVGVLGILSWGQHMLVSGIMPDLRAAFTLLSLAIAVPLGYIVFSWIAALWAGRVRFSTPMLFSLGFVSILSLGGVAGVVMASAPSAAQLEGTYFEIGTLHLAVFGASISGLFAGIYYWFPRLVGRELNEDVGRLHFLAYFGGVHMTYLPMFVAGLLGAPSRVVDFHPELEPLQVAISGGAGLLATAALVFLYNAYFGWRSGAAVTTDPWAGLDPLWGGDE